MSHNLLWRRPVAKRFRGCGAREDCSTGSVIIRVRLQRRTAEGVMDTEYTNPRRYPKAHCSLCQLTCLVTHRVIEYRTGHDLCGRVAGK